MELNKVYQTDCFELVKLMPDNFIDLVIIDPPYGDNIPYGRNGKEILNNEDESINYRFLDSILPKMKQNTSLYLFSNHKFCHAIKEYACRIGYSCRMLCILVKNNFGLGHGFRNQYKVCIVLEKGEAKYNLNNMSNVWYMKHVQHDENSHPHQKDYNIIRRIIMHSSNEGDLIFDGFMGSFSTAIACHKEKRNFIGAELDAKWYTAGYKKLDALQRQVTMF